MDYDVEVLGLKTPASTSPLAPYRLVVSVRNNGIHAAVASGYVRVYSASLLIFESEVWSNTLAPGVTGDCSSLGYWTPPAEGFYMIQGYISTPLDQVEPNNNLNPTNIHITGTPPTPPTPVALHAAQHEEDGTDELSIDGLKGRAADPQTALAHAAQHQAGGTDALNVGSLLGVLATDQPAQAHSNTRHNPTMATTAELESHRLSVAAHTAATNLANRETTGPEAGIVKGAQLALGSVIGGTDATRFLARNRFWCPAPSSVPVGLFALWSIGLAIPTDWIAALGIPPPSPGFFWITYTPAP